ncbi:MAG: hypothetical protein IPM99_06995 [Rubrivivax sp.]|nr:hypothetical protein [Rubrivivax sp.]
MRAVLHPLSRSPALWRRRMERHRQSLVPQYHNGGIWPFMAASGSWRWRAWALHAQAWRQLAALARANADGGWRFTEWFHGRSLAPLGMAGRKRNAATLPAGAAQDGGPA